MTINLSQLVPVGEPAPKGLKIKRWSESSQCWLKVDRPSLRKFLARHSKLDFGDVSDLVVNENMKSLASSLGKVISVYPFEEKQVRIVTTLADVEEQYPVDTTVTLEDKFEEDL